MLRSVRVPRGAEPARGLGRSGGRRTRGAIAVVVVGLVVLVGCAAPKHQTPVTPEAAPSPPPGVEDALASFYTQIPEWRDCGTFQCASVRVPLNWDAPAEGSIGIAVSRLPASGEKIGSLLINPGGPGGSGIDLLQIASSRFGNRVLEAYDIVGFDPRGVGQSQAVACISDVEKDFLYAHDFDFESESGMTQAVAAWQEYGEACARETGALLGHVDTVSAARDMDVLRAVLGDEALNYLGYSYGTILGATYAALHPETVGRMVLDGGLDPTLDDDAVAVEQAAGFERALRAYVEYCQRLSGCPLPGSVEDGLERVRELSERTRRNPLPTGEDGRDLTATRLFYGIALPLYDDAAWGWLTQAFTEAIQEGHGETFGFLADQYFDRSSDGVYQSNSQEVFHAVGCLDATGEVTLESMRANAAEFVRVAPTLGRSFSYHEVVCLNWPHEPAEPLVDYSADGAGPIVVIGTTGDPATPYDWSVGLAKALSSGVLVTFEGEGHTAYGRSNGCVHDAVDDYLVDGTAPADGLVC